MVTQKTFLEIAKRKPEWRVKVGATTLTKALPTVVTFEDAPIVTKVGMTEVAEFLSKIEGVRGGKTSEKACRSY